MNSHKWANNKYHHGLAVMFLKSAHVLFNLLNSLRKRDKMLGKPCILSLFRNEFNLFENTRARKLDTFMSRNSIF